MRVPVPAGLRDHLGSEGTPAATRDAATVVVVRDGADGLEAYLLRRQRTMAFAAGMYVFPGGGVDASDAELDVPWAGPEPAEWAGRFGCDEPTARALVCAAVRETFEESGVLLAGPDATTVVADTSGADWLTARRALEAHEYTFGTFLRERGLVLRSDLLGAWAHWITPEFEPRRFDTRFFVAVLPEGQVVGELPGEADRGVWASLSAAVAAVDGGEAVMLPPTRITCGDLLGLRADEVLDVSTHRTIPVVLPRVVEVDGAFYLESFPEGHA